MADEGGAPVELPVYMCAVNWVLRIDELSNSATFDCALFFIWNTTTPIKSECEGHFESVESLPWHPGISFYSVTDKIEMECALFKNNTTGNHGAFLNWILVSFQPFNFSRFPFDTQVLKLKFEVDAPKVRPFFSGLHVPTAFNYSTHSTLFYCEVGNWSMENVYQVVQFIEGAKGESPTCGIVLKVVLRRNPGYYLTNVVLLCYILVQGAFTTVAVPNDREHVSDRMSITLTILLTIVAFKFVVLSIVPPSSYSTLLDKYLICGVIVIGLIIIENVTACYLDPTDATNLDYAVCMTVGIIWTLLNAAIVLGGQTSIFYETLNEVELAGSYDEPERSLKRRGTLVRPYQVEGAKQVDISRETSDTILLMPTQRRSITANNMINTGRAMRRSSKEGQTTI